MSVGERPRAIRAISYQDIILERVAMKAAVEETASSDMYSLSHGIRVYVGCVSNKLF